MYGTIVSADDRDVVVEIAPGVQVTMLRRAIMDVVPVDDQGGASTTGASSTDRVTAPENGSTEASAAGLGR